MKFKINDDRFDESVRARMREGLQQAKAGAEPETVLQSVAQGVADAALLMYQDRVRAALRRAGFAVPDGQQIDLDLMRELIGQRTGIELEGWDETSVRDAVMKAANRYVSNRIGFDVDMTGDIEDQVKKLVIDAVKTGRANAIVSRAMLTKIQTRVPFAKLGVTPADRAAALARHARRKWARSHEYVWVN